MNAPAPDELVELLFSEVLVPPEGYEYYPKNRGSQLLFPVYGSDQWRILLHKIGATADAENLFPIFLEGDFVRKITKALHAMQRELNQAVSTDFPDPVSKVPQ